MFKKEKPSFNEDWKREYKDKKLGVRDGRIEKIRYIER